MISYRWRSIAGLAWRESRGDRKRLLLYMSSISLGVAALVAIDSFAANITRSVLEQSRTLTGGDVVFSSGAPFKGDVALTLDSLARARTPVARMTSFPAMAVASSQGTARLAQVRAISEAYPLYGTITTDPAGRWNELERGRKILVDPSLLVALKANIGDTIALGSAQFVVAGTLRDVPGATTFAEMLAPRVFVSMRHVPEMELLGFGSRAMYNAYIKLPPAHGHARRGERTESHPGPPRIH
jgi:putative ABC transport system permease protein